VCVQSKGWCNGRVAKIWIECVLKLYLEDSDASFLLVDHFKVHLSSDFVRACNDLGTEVDFILAGYTCVLKPLDVGVNAPFKAHYCDHGHDWSLAKLPGHTENQKFPMPKREDIYPWILSAFDKMSCESIVQTFAHIGLTMNHAQEAETEISEENSFSDDDVGIIDNDDDPFDDEYDRLSVRDQLELVGVNYNVENDEV